MVIHLNGENVVRFDVKATQFQKHISSAQKKSVTTQEIQFMISVQE
jgi:hypothetical protein